MESTRSTTPSYEPLLAEDEKDIYEGLPTILSKTSYGKERRSRWWEHRGFALLLLVVYSLVLLKLPSLWSSQRLDPFLTYSMWLCSSLKRAIGNVTDVSILAKHRQKKPSRSTTDIHSMAAWASRTSLLDSRALMRKKPGLISSNTTTSASRMRRWRS